MVLGDVSKISMGAAAGVVAERAGYVDVAVSRFSREYGSAAEAFGLPALPDASVLIAPPNVSDPTEFALPSSLGELQDRVVASLEKAREMMREYVPGFLTTSPLAGAGEGADPGAGAGAGDASVVAVASDVSTSALVPVFFLAGAGTAAVLYYFGPERVKTFVDARVSETRTAATALMKRVDRTLADVGVKSALIAARARAEAALALAASMSTHPRVVAASSSAAAAATRAAEAVTPAAERAFLVAKEGAERVVAAATPSVRRLIVICAASIESAAAAVKPYLAASLEAVKPRAETARAAVEDFLAAVKAALAGAPDADKK